MDMRLQNLSYSGTLLLNSCPRKFELQKLKSAYAENTDSDGTQSITFAFGHSVGEGIQWVLAGKSEAEILWGMFLSWEIDFLAQDEKRGKGFFEAVVGVQKFAALRKAGLLEGYEMVYYQGKPACELSFCVHLPNGFKFRGSIDAVLRHVVTGKVVVIEGKTTWSSTVNQGSYKNSSQALGYSIILDLLFPELSSYDVFYPVYKTKAMEWEVFKFTKLYSQRAEWLKSLLFSCEEILKYEAEGYFPKRGESCTNWGRDCEYLGICGMSTKYLVREMSEQEIAEASVEYQKYQIQVTFEELIASQVRKLEAMSEEEKEVPRTDKAAERMREIHAIEDEML